MVSNKISIYVQVTLTLCLVSGLNSHDLCAQDLNPIELETVDIIGSRVSMYAIGARTFVLDSSLLNLESIPNLASLLDNYTAISTKSYGNGMLSTISFRGTGPSHTAILWHGVNIAYPMLGQSDLSLLSMALTDDLKIQYGTSSTLYGTGALGGTVALANLDPRAGTVLSIDQWLGSFGTVKNRISASHANSKYYIKVNTLWDHTNNDFKFKNTTKPGFPTEIQQGADYSILGSAIESGFKFKRGSRVSLAAQYLLAERNLQPSMNANSSGGDVQTDENIRLRTAYQHKGSTLDWNTSYTFLKDAISFNGAKTVSDQHIVQAGANMNLMTMLRMNLSSDYMAISISSPFYSESITRENRMNFRASFLLNPYQPLYVSINLRQSINQDYKIPFTPSLGTEFEFMNNPGTLLKAKTILSRGFRVPTLNERYWQPGGNPDLVPEDSYSAEIGFEGLLERTISISYEITAYRMWVENWILWRPQGSFWSPENIKKVDVYGIEGSGKIGHNLGSINIEWIGNYAFTKSINRTGLDKFDRSVNKQLSYVPIHKATLSSIMGMGSWSAAVNASFTGVRFTTADNENQLPAYTLLNFRVSKRIKKGSWNITGHVNVNNILNTQYQSIENKAMPGINFLAGINLSFNKLNKL